MKHPSTVQQEQIILALGRHGFSYALMEQRTRENHSSIYRVLKGAGVKLRDYRNGETQEARSVIRELELPRIRIRRAQ